MSERNGCARARCWRSSPCWRFWPCGATSTPATAVFPWKSWDRSFPARRAGASPTRWWTCGCPGCSPLFWWAWGCRFPGAFCRASPATTWPTRACSASMPARGCSWPPSSSSCPRGLFPPPWPCPCSPSRARRRWPSSAGGCRWCAALPTRAGCCSSASLWPRGSPARRRCSCCACPTATTPSCRTGSPAASGVPVGRMWPSSPWGWHCSRPAPSTPRAH